ncbi:glycoside hydrolase family 28 protein [Celeribacter arenosi]|uniref:Glycoside hydrolase family 28 protein n=1 Tax=Celeribacter arenosi TaxID=792649 RepID=A0ABP7KHA4_9RHOB
MSDFIDTVLRPSVVTPRYGVMMLGGLRYTSPHPVFYRLDGPEGTVEGETNTAVIRLPNLRPAQDYRLTATANGEVMTLSFETPVCAGLIDARDYGLSQESDDNAYAIHRAVAAAPDGGTVYIPAGRFQTTPLFPKGNITLHLDAGAELIAHSDRDKYGNLYPRDPDGRMLGTWEGLPARCYASLVSAIDCNHLSIVGDGVLNGGGAEGDWWTWPKETRNGARRPRTLFATRCANLQVAGITVRNSPSWTVHPVQCKGAVFSGLTIENPPDSPNTDGLNPEMCEETLIEGVRFSVGDDCIAIKAGKSGPDGEDDHLFATRGVIIRQCRMERGHGAVVIGSEMSGDVRDVSIDACEFTGTDRGLRIKTRRGRGGRVQNIQLRDVVMDNVETAFSGNAHYFCDPDGHSRAVQDRNPAPVTKTTPSVTDISIEDVEINDLHVALAAFLGLAEAPITGVHLSNVRYRFAPNAKEGVPLMADDVAKMRHVAIWSENAQIAADQVVELSPTDGVRT